MNLTFAADACFADCALETHGCRVTARGFRGAVADELYLVCVPSHESVAAAIAGTYAALIEALRKLGGGDVQALSETVYFRDIARDGSLVSAARERILRDLGATSYAPARTNIQQPPLAPLDGGSGLAIAVQAVAPRSLALENASVSDSTASILSARMGDEHRLYASGIAAGGSDAAAQTTAMFERAEQILQGAGMQFDDVVRTWIHLRQMERDYAAFNAARRAFFHSRGVRPVPASTGIVGGPAEPAQDLLLGIYAVRGPGRVARAVMSSPTLNEAGEYGADFVRGMRVRERNRDAVFLSGTASIDERGNSAHPGDIDAQLERMLLNARTLLEGQGAGFGDIACAVTYLKHPEHERAARRHLEAAGYGGFPMLMLHAPICRDDLLCETEALALLPAAATSAG